MARPDLHGKLVRVYPERSEPRAEVFGQPIPAHVDWTKEVTAFAEAKGYPSGTVCKVVMVSRMGDVGLTRRLRDTHGYDFRIEPECLEEVSAEELPRLLHEYDVKRLHPDVQR